MGIERLLEILDEKNIADNLDKDILDDLGLRVRRQFDEDTASMKDWIESVENGLDLMKQEFQPKSHPWTGASNYKSPLLSEASISFGDKASLEVLRQRNLVKADIIGKDQTGEKKKLSDRVTEAMNYQINYERKRWRKEQKRMMYVLPNIGVFFKKPVFDPLLGRADSHVIQYPDFAVNQATTNMDDCRSFTQILDIDQNGVIDRQNLGIWRDVDLYPEDSDGDEGSNESAETPNAESNPDRFLEQQCFADLDEDGIEEPYVVTLHESSSTVVRIVPRYDERSFIVRLEDGRIMNLSDAIRIEAERHLSEQKALPEEPDISKYEFVRVVPDQNITKYGFIPSPDGTFLDLGYSHLLGALTMGINSTTNQLTDSGTLRNAGGGFLAKGFRKKMGPISIAPGKYASTDMQAKDLHQGILSNPNPEPSQVLFALNEKLEQQARSFAAIVDASGQITANTAPTTALAIIQEALISTSALIGNVLDGMSEEFQVLFRINKKTFDPALYKKILDDENANAFVDFNNESLDIVPTASPEMSSKLQRIQLSSVEVEQIPNVIAAGGNPLPIVRNFFERIGSNNIDEIFPENPTDQQAKEIAQFREAQELSNQLQQQQLELSQIQTEILSREQDRLDAETSIKIDESIGKLKKMEADIVLILEKAETEEVKNNINLYTAQIQSTISMLTAIGADDDRRRNARVNEKEAAGVSRRLQPVA